MINTITGCARAKHRSMLLRSEPQPVIVCYRDVSQEFGVSLKGHLLTLIVDSLDAVLTDDPYIELTLCKHSRI